MLPIMGRSAEVQLRRSSQMYSCPKVTGPAAGDVLRASEYNFLVQQLKNETVDYKIFLFSLPKAANSPLAPRAILAVPKLACWSK